MRPCTSCVDRGTPHLCKWADGPTPPRSEATAGRVDVDLTSDGMDDENVNEDEISPALRDTKLDLKENSEILKILSQRIQSLEKRVVAGSVPTAASRRTSVSIDSSMTSGPAFRNTTGIEGMFQTRPLAGSGSTSGIGAGSFEYGAPTPSVALHDLSPSTTTASVTSPPTHPSQIHVPTRPQGSRRQSETSFRVPSVPQDESYRRVAAFSPVHRGEFLGQGNVLCSLHSVCVQLPILSLLPVHLAFRYVHRHTFVYHLLDRRRVRRYRRRTPLNLPKP